MVLVGSIAVGTYSVFMESHDVTRFVNGLSEKLASRSRHVCLFTGAGVSRACGLPDVAGLTSYVVEELEQEQRAIFETLLRGRDLEQVLSRVRRIASLLEDSLDIVDGLTSTTAKAMDSAICGLIIKKLTTSSVDLTSMYKLAAWAGRSDYREPVEFFTVNYDLLLETGLEAIGVPYFDGFVGNLNARFRGDLVEDVNSTGDRAPIPSYFARLWKLHGSLHWTWTEEQNPKVIRQGGAIIEGRTAAIYPSDAKYDESRRVPFVFLQDRFRRALNSPETLLLISGYAFGDQHLNEIIFDSARTRPRSEFITFCFSDIPQVVAEFARITPNFQVVAPKEAILSGLHYEWAEPNGVPSDVWHDGEFLLGNFEYLSQFLARSSPRQGELEERLSALLAEAAREHA